MIKMKILERFMKIHFLKLDKWNLNKENKLSTIQLKWKIFTKNWKSLIHFLKRKNIDISIGKGRINIGIEGTSAYIVLGVGVGLEIKRNISKNPHNTNTGNAYIAIAGVQVKTIKGKKE